MKRILFSIIAILVLAVALAPAPVNAQSPYAYQIFLPLSNFTAASQTGRVITLGRAYATGTISLVGHTLTTAGIQVLGSSDGGITYVALGMWAEAVPGTVATSETVTANGIFRVNLGGITHVKLATTSGTFTGTSIDMTLTAGPYYGGS